MSTPFDDLYALSDAARLWAVGCYESCNDSRIWRTESWGIALGFLFFAHMPTSPAFSIPAHRKEKAHALRRLGYSG